MDLELNTILHYFISHWIFVYNVKISPEFVLTTREVYFPIWCLYWGSLCHDKVFANPFSSKCKASTHFTQYCDLLDPLIKNILDSSPRYRSNVTFGTSQAFQMREEYMFEKNNFWNLDFKGGKYWRYAHFTRSLRMFFRHSWALNRKVRKKS